MKSKYCFSSVDINRWFILNLFNVQVLLKWIKISSDAYSMFFIVQCYKFLPSFLYVFFPCRIQIKLRGLAVVIQNNLYALSHIYRQFKLCILYSTSVILRRGLGGIIVFFGELQRNNPSPRCFFSD